LPERQEINNTEYTHMSIKKRHYVYLLAAMFLATTNLNAEEIGSVGISVGEKAPEVQLKDQHNKLRTLSEILKDGPVALVFHRSADW